MKKLFSFAVLSIILVVTVSVIGVVWWSGSTSALTPGSEDEIRVVIPKGRSAEQVGEILEEEGVIKSSLAFKMYVQIFNKSKNINAGQFELSPSMSVSDVVETLGKGPLQLWVTIPEGLRREQMVARFVTGLEKEGTDADNFRTSFLSASEGEEGYLYPNTYLFSPEVTGGKVVESMLALFNSQTSAMQQDISGMTLDEIVTLASLVEKETKTDEERPIVAGIILKRIENEWTIDIDASVQYGVANRKCGSGALECDDWWPIITRNDIDREGPYNVYKKQGLPPTPIANPGLSSIKAAIYPEESDYWFYIHDTSGTIRFAETIEEHNENVRKYLR